MAATGFIKDFYRNLGNGTASPEARPLIGGDR